MGVPAVVSWYLYPMRQSPKVPDRNSAGAEASNHVSDLGFRSVGSGRSETGPKLDDISANEMYFNMNEISFNFCGLSLMPAQHLVGTARTWCPRHWCQTRSPGMKPPGKVVFVACSMGFVPRPVVRARPEKGVSPRYWVRSVPTTMVSIRTGSEV
jgi:hypothetical protein